MKDEKCKNVCQRVYNADRKEDKDRLKFLKKGIANNYYHHWYVLVLYPGGKEHHLRSSSYMSCTGCINQRISKGSEIVMTVYSENMRNILDDENMKLIEMHHN